MSSLLSYQKFLLNREDLVSVSEASGEIFNTKRGKKIQFRPVRNEDLEDEIYHLIQTAYAEIGGHSKIKKPADVFADPDWNYWEGVDLHNTADFDLVIFGQRTNYGIKYSGVGHDGSKIAKTEYLDGRGENLKKLGYYAEVSGKLAEILINKYRVPVVTDREAVSQVLGKPIAWHGNHPEDSQMPGDGWYVRNIAGKPHAKIMLGRPKA
jgi:hypothetical protein